MRKVAAFILYLTLFVAFWNAIDWLFTAFVTRSSYQFSVQDGLIFPLIMGTVLEVVPYLRKKKQN